MPPFYILSLMIIVKNKSHHFYSESSFLFDAEFLRKDLDHLS